MLLKEIDKFWDKICQFPRKITKKIDVYKKNYYYFICGQSCIIHPSWHYSYSDIKDAIVETMYALSLNSPSKKNPQ